MPIYEIGIDDPFPETSQAEPDGMLAYGGDVSPLRLLMAYPQGIFPWYNPGQPPIWWAPHDRCVLFPELMHCSKSLLKVIKKQTFELRIDSAFDQVVEACGKVGANRTEGTWLNEDLRASLSALHQMGIAHSFESWRDGKLVGGLYGISMGKMFFGESMFAAESDASKVAFFNLCQWMMNHDLKLIDCQIPNDHLISLGAQILPRDEFYPLLDEFVNKKTKMGPWEISML